MITPAEAEKLIGQHLPTLPIESLPLVQCAGSVLRENIYAERDEPPFDRVAMDGIALDTAALRSGLRSFPIEGTQAAGDPPLQLRNTSGCLEAMTGAMLPSGCDAVVPVEQITVTGGAAALKDGLSAEPWQHVHRRGTDTRQGTLLLATGTRLNAPEVAIAAGAGMARVRVSSQPMLMVVSTGNELVEPGETILPHQIRRSNVYGIVAALRRHGFTRVADDHVRDAAEDMRLRLQQHLTTHDVLILSGGVSMGKFDLVPGILAELGVRQVFHRVEQRPGKPMWFGVTATGKAVFGLPGNPVSTLVGVSRYVVPALAAAMGEPPVENRSIALRSDVTVATKLAHFVPVRLTTDESGRAWAAPRLTNNSGDFTALAGTDGFVELPPGPNTYAKGFVAPLYRW